MHEPHRGMVWRSRWSRWSALAFVAIGSCSAVHLPSDGSMAARWGTARRRSPAAKARGPRPALLAVHRAPLPPRRSMSRFSSSRTADLKRRADVHRLPRADQRRCCRWLAGQALHVRIDAGGQYCWGCRSRTPRRLRGGLNGGVGPRPACDRGSWRCDDGGTTSGAAAAASRPADPLTTSKGGLADPASPAVWRWSPRTTPPCAGPSREQHDCSRFAAVARRTALIGARYWRGDSSRGAYAGVLGGARCGCCGVVLPAC